MIYHTYTQKYDEDTGRPLGLGINNTYTACDWSGELSAGLPDVFRARWYLETGQFTFTYRDVHDKAKKFSEDFLVDIDVLMNTNDDAGGPFVVRSDYVEEAIDAFKSGDCQTFVGFWMDIRLEMARRKIEKGDLLPYQIPGFERPPSMYGENWEEKVWPKAKEEMNWSPSD